MSASCLVPAGSAAALICDTGALLDYLVESAPDHRLFRNAIDRARTRYVPALVLAEVDYFLRDERRAMQVFMQARGAFTCRPLPTCRPRWVNSHARWRLIGDTRISVSASSTALSSRLPRLSASAGWRRGMCTISPLFDYTMVVGSIWSLIRRIPTYPERHIAERVQETRTPLRNPRYKSAHGFESM